MRRTPSARSVALAGLLAAIAAATVPFGTAAWSADSASDRPAAESAGSPASEPRSVVGTARAQGVRATYTVPDYVVVSEFFDGGGPVTEALADSTGRATSFSSLPWPGSNAVTAPGTLSVALGQSVPLAYPFHVRADHPTTPSASLSDPTGAYTIAAAAEAGKATAAGSFEAPGEVSGSRARTSAVLDDGGVVRVLAETVDTGISVGDGALRIASVRSRSETTLAPGDVKPVTVSELLIEGASVGGTPVTIDGDGLHAADRTLPAPIGEGASTENDLLGQAGISVSVVPTGVAGGADALVITSRQSMPLPTNPKGTLVLRIGGAASEIVVGSADLPLETPATPGGDLPAESEAAASPGAAAAGSAPAGGGAGGTDSLDASFAPGLPEVRQPLDFPLPTPGSGGSGPADPGTGPNGVGTGLNGAAANGVPANLLPGSGGSLAVGAATAAGVSRPVVPDLATTGALFSLLAGGSLALVVATRLHRFSARKARA